MERFRYLKIKYKFIILVAGTFLAFMAAASAIHILLVRPVFFELEEHDAEKNYRRIVHALEREIYHLDRLCNDWSTWDSLFNYINTRNSSFINANLGPETFAFGNFDQVIILDRNLNRVYALGYNHPYREKLKSEVLVKNENLLKSSVLKKSSKFNRPIEEVRGVLVTDIGLMLVSARNVLLRTNPNASNGVIIMSKLLDERIMMSIREQTEIDFSVFPVEQSFLSPEIKKKLIGSLPVKLLINRSEKKINVYALRQDIAGSGKYVLHISIPMAISVKGDNVIKLAIFFLVVATIAVLLIVILTIDRSIVSPVNSLIDQVKRIAKGDYARRGTVPSNNELGLLSMAVDDMAQIISTQTNELKGVNERLELMSITDSLTGAYNRRHFDNVVRFEWERAFRAKEPMSLIMIDIDYFKPYNDTYGHVEGDKCLKAISTCITDNLRRETDHLYRYGGEEFAIILPNTSHEGAAHVASSIVEAVSAMEMPHSASKYHRITISAGSATKTPALPKMYSELIVMADKALYHSKKNGRNMAVSASAASSSSADDYIYKSC